MDWFRTHPASVTIAVLALFFFGFLIVERQSPTNNSYDANSGTWINPDTISAIPAASANDSATANPSPPVGGTDSSRQFTSPFGSSSPQTPASASTLNDTQGQNADIDSLLSLISKPSRTKNQSTKPASADAYAYVPSGLISIASAGQSDMTPTQQALYEYGNQVGSDIQGFELSHSNQPQILTDFADDRTNPDKIAAMKRLGSDLSALGDLIDSTDPVPTQMTNAQAALAASYREIGTKLGKIPDANQTDATLVNAMEVYDASADKFARNFVSFAQLFPAYGVKFSNSDGGSVFMFQNTQGL